MELLENDLEIIIYSLIGFILFCFILYKIIKAAIKDAHREMDEMKKMMLPPTKPLANPNWNSAQLSLRNKYEKGELTFEEYMAEWNKIS